MASYWWLLTVNLALTVSTRGFYTISIASCMAHIAWCKIPCDAMLKLSFLTLRDKFRDKLLKLSEVEIMTEQSTSNTNVELSRD
jgi:hypothetical protein